MLSQLSLAQTAIPSNTVSWFSRYVLLGCPLGSLTPISSRPWCPSEDPESPDPLQVLSLKTLLPVDIPQPEPGAPIPDF